MQAESGTAEANGAAVPAERERRSGIAVALLAIAAGLVAGLVYYVSPVLQVTDSNYGMLLAEQAIVGGSLRLDAYFPPHTDSRGYPEVARGEQLPRHVHEVGGHLYHKFPVGTPLLSVPFVLVARLAGTSTIDADGRFDARAERSIQRVVAATVTGATVAVLFLLANLLLPLGPSLAIALAAAFATQLWSTASRATWSHTWSLLLVTSALWFIVRWSRIREASGGDRVGRPGLRPVVVGVLLSLAFFVRPTSALTILPLVALVLFRDRRAGVQLIATGAVCLSAFVVHSLATYGELLPHYFRRGALLGGGDFAAGLASNLVSPSRGVLVLVPLTWVVLWLLWRERSGLRLRGLALALGVAAVAHVLVVSSYDNWWGGVSYGPRFTTDLIPHGVVLGAIALSAARERRGGIARGELAAFALAVLLGVLVHGAGAWSRAGARWNAVPVPIRQDRMRVFDWSRPQPLCALFPALLPTPLPDGGARRERDRP